MPARRGIERHLQLGQDRQFQRLARLALPNRQNIAVRGMLNMLRPEPDDVGTALHSPEEELKGKALAKRDSPHPLAEPAP